MTFTVTAMSRCAGQGHWHFTVQVGQQTRELTIKTEDMNLEPEDLETVFLGRVRSAAKEAGATTFQQARTAIVGKAFQL